MTGQELFEAFCKREGISMEWDMVSPHSVWVWEKAAKYVEAFGGADPLKNIRQIRAGDNL